MEQVQFKIKSLGMMRDLLRQGDWMVSVDLKDGYQSVTIWEDDRKYLRFKWQGSIYIYCLV